MSIYINVYILRYKAGIILLRMSEENQEIPEEFICPISFVIMKDPYVDLEGNSYEKEEIFRWLSTKSVSPITRNSLDKSKLAPNRALKTSIERYCRQEETRRSSSNLGTASASTATAAVSLPQRVASESEELKAIRLLEAAAQRRHEEEAEWRLQDEDRRAVAAGNRMSQARCARNGGHDWRETRNMSRIDGLGGNPRATWYKCNNCGVINKVY